MKVWIVAPLVLTIASVAMAQPPLAVSEKAERSLGEEPVTVAVPLPEGLAARAQRLRVVVEGLKLVHPGAVYEVYLNLPEGRQPDPESVYFLGNLALFGVPADDDAPAGQRSFDVTEQVAAQRASGEWTGEIELTFVRGNPEARAVAGPTEFIRFSHISVVERP